MTAGNIKLDLLLDIKGTNGFVDLQKQLQLVQTGMKQLQTQSAAVGAPMQGMVRQVSAANDNISKFGNAARNAAFQVSDFFVMIDGGMSVSRALATQLPQLTAQMGAFGVAIGAAAGILIPFAADMQIVQDNLDRIIGYAAGAAAVLGGKFLLGLSAASGGLLAASKAAIAFTFSLQGLKTILISTGFGAIAVALGEAVAAFIRLKEQTGSWGAAAGVVFKAIGGLVTNLIEVISNIDLVASAAWNGFLAAALTALSGAIGAVARLTNAFSSTLEGLGLDTAASGIAGVGAQIDGLSQSVANSAAGYFRDASRSMTELNGKLTENAAGWQIIDAFTKDYQGTLTATNDEVKKTGGGLAKQSEAAKKTSQDLDAYRRSLEGARTPMQALVADLKAAEENLRKFGQFLTPEELELAKQQIDQLKAKIDELNNGSLVEFRKSITDTFKQIPDMLAGGLTDAIMSFVDGTKSAKEAFKEFAVNFLKQVTQMIIKATLLFAIQKALGGFGGGFGGFFSNGGAFANGVQLYAKGAAFQAGQIKKFATGGVVGGPSFFPMAGGRTGLMGEAGPEAIMPLTRRNGKLGVEAAPMNVVINNNSDAAVRVRQEQNKLLVDVALAEVGNQLARGGGPIDRAIQNGYGLRRSGR